MNNNDPGRRIPTDVLTRRIIKTTDFDKFIAGNRESMSVPKLSEFLHKLCSERNMTVADVIRQANLSRSYGYQIFKGQRIPSRDCLIRLAITLKLNSSQTQEMLKIARKPLLYPRIEREAALIFCLENGLDMDDTQELLEQRGCEHLGDAEND